MNIRSTKIREVYPDFIKRLRISTKDFNEYISNPNSKKLLDETNLEFIKSCYYDDIQELEEIIFFTSYPFYEFKEAYNSIYITYDRLKYALKNDSEWGRSSFWNEYEKLIESSVLDKIKFRDQKFYFNGDLVPTNPHDENCINIIAFEIINEVKEFIEKFGKKFYQLIDAEFLKDHDFDECYDYCYEITNWRR